MGVRWGQGTDEEALMTLSFTLDPLLQQEEGEEASRAAVLGFLLTMLSGSAERALI